MIDILFVLVVILIYLVLVIRGTIRTKKGVFDGIVRRDENGDLIGGKIWCKKHNKPYLN